MEGEADHSFRQYINQYNLVKLLRQIGSFVTWNGEMFGSERPHTLIQRIVEAHAGGSSRNASGQVVRRAFKLASDQGDATRSGRSPVHRARSMVPGSPGEVGLLRWGVGRITNHGPPAQMLNYALDRYAQVNDLLLDRLGFTVEGACLASQIVSFRLVDATSPFLTPGSPPRQRLRGPAHNSTKLLVPPASFTSAWIAASKYPAPSAELRGASELTHKVVEFLTADPSGFASTARSFSRWAFVREADGGSGLLVSQMLAETMLSALQIGLLDTLKAQERGNFGNKIGLAYEGFVAGLFKRHWPATSVKSRLRSSVAGSEIDLLVQCKPGADILLECKGRALQPAARWGDAKVFDSNLRHDVIEAAHQAAKGLSELESRDEVASVVLVLDAYFPGATFLAHSGGLIGKALEGLPSPIVTTHYDLDYLLRKLRPDEFIEYARWRQAALQTRRLVVVDEFDLVRAFFQLRSLPVSKLRTPGNLVVFIGDDKEYERTLFQELAERMQSIPAARFGFDRPATPGPG
jgi:hypothetical protein